MVAHFWWASWEIRSHRSFLVSDLSNLLTSLIKNEGLSESLVYKKKCTKNVPKNMILVKKNLSESLVFVIKRANERFAQKKRAICPEGSEQIAHSHSFNLSDLSNLSNLSNLSKWANSQLCRLLGHAHCTFQTLQAYSQNKGRQTILALSLGDQIECCKQNLFSLSLFSDLSRGPWISLTWLEYFPTSCPFLFLSSRIQAGWV